MLLFLRRVAGALLIAASLAVAALLATAVPRATLDPPRPTYLVRDAHGAYLMEVPTDAERGYWPLSEVPPRVAAATLSLEDRRFRHHQGVDLVAVARAVQQNASSGEVISGASTLAMQVARMQDPGPRTLWKKAVEALTAVLITQRYGRDAVLRQYLTLAPYGNRIHGIGYAARRYLDKPVEDLSWAEIAFLAAMPQAPGRTNPWRDSGRERAHARGERILDALYADGVLTDTEYATALLELQDLHLSPQEQRPDDALHAVLWLEEELSRPAWREHLDGAPLVRSTLDLELQATVAGHLRDVVRANEHRDAGNAAAVVVERGTWRVLAAVGSTGYADARRAGAIDYARTQRSPGSTLKPFLYGLALERGVIRTNTVLDDLHRGPDGVTNYDHTYLGPMLPREALANSRNVPAVRLLQEVGLGETWAYYRDLGLHDDTLTPDYYGLGLAIGGMPVTLVDLVTAYTAVAGDGTVHELTWIDGGPTPAPRRVMEAETAAWLTHALSDPMARLPSFPRMGSGELPFPAALKTGTSSQYRDAWTVAWTDRVLVGVWVGRPDWRPMQGLSGGRVAGELARRVLLDVHADEADGLADLAFPPPAGWESARVCAQTGHLDQGACDRVVEEWFPPGTVPTEVDVAHRRLAIDRRTGLIATTSTPREQVVQRTYVDLGPRYASWQRDRGLPLPPDRPSVLGPDAVAVAPIQPGLVPRDVRLHITAPQPDLRLTPDPEAPDGQSTLALRVEVEPRVDQILWLVDGRPWRVVDYPYTARWPLEPGEHHLQAQVPWTDMVAQDVRIWVE